MCSTPTDNKFASTYEAENQAILEAYQAQECTVVRNLKGEVVQASVTYTDGSSEPIYHVSARDVVGPVSVTSSTKKSETAHGIATPDDVRGRDGE